VFCEVAEIGELVQRPPDCPLVAIDFRCDVADRELLAAILSSSARHRPLALRERLDHRSVRDDRQALGERCRVREHDRAFLVTAEPEDRLERLILAHMFEVRVGRRTVVIEVGTVAGPVDALAREGGPFLDHCIAEVPAAEHRTQVQLSERVRPGDVPVVVDGCDVLLDPASDLLFDLLSGNDAGFGRRGERILTQLCRGELLGDFLYERNVAVEVLAAPATRSRSWCAG
jgi:hypothetical protein